MYAFVLQAGFVFSAFFNQKFVWMSPLVRAAFSSHRILLDLLIVIQLFSTFRCLRHACMGYPFCFAARRDWNIEVSFVIRMHVCFSNVIDFFRSL